MYWELFEIFRDIGAPLNDSILSYPFYSGLYGYSLHVATILLVVVSVVLPFSFVIRMFRR